MFQAEQGQSFKLNSLNMTKIFGKKIFKLTCAKIVIFTSILKNDPKTEIEKCKE